MNKQVLAQLIDGAEYRDEVSPDIIRVAKENNLVIVFGASDDLMEFRGAIDDEIGCYDGGTAYLTSEGLIEECECECKYYKAAKSKSKKINAIWHDAHSEYDWTYETDIPHETFDIFEDGEKYCRGIVFSMDDLIDPHAKK